MTGDDEAPKVEKLLGDVWQTLHGIEQVAGLLWDDNGDEAVHGAAFTIK